MNQTNTEAIKVVRDTRQEWRKLCQTDLYFLCKFVLGFEDLEPSPHIEMCEFVSGPAQWKLFVGSRGILKTTICTVARPIQITLQDPNARCLIIQANDATARGPLSQIREKFEQCTLLRELFPEIIPSAKERKSGRWSTQWIELKRTKTYSEPTFRAIGVSGSLVGTHWSHIFRDDIVAAKKDSVTGEIIAPPPEDVEKAIGQHKLVHGLMTDPTKCEVYDICNRWSRHDFARYLLDTGGYKDPNNHSHEYMIMPAAENWPEGELLWPERYSREALKTIEEDQGSYFFSSQYLCRPVDAARSLFKRKDLRFWVEEKTQPEDVTLPPEEEMIIYAIMDQAQKISQRACYTAVVVVGIDKDNRWFILDTVRQRINATDKIDLIFQLADRWNVYGRNVFGVESNLAQGILTEWLRDQQSKRGKVLNIQELRPPNNMSKDMRIEALQPYFEQHRVFLKAGPSQDALIQELTDYPFGRYRDLIDALTYVHRICVARRKRSANPRIDPFSYEGIRSRLLNRQKSKSFFNVQDKLATPSVR